LCAGNHRSPTINQSSQAHKDMGPKWEAAINYTNIVVTALMAVEMAFR